MKNNPKILTALILSFLSFLTSVFARGFALSVFLLPAFISYYNILKGKVLFNKKEGNILALLFVILFVIMFFRFDPFVVGLYFLCGLLSLKLFVTFEEKDYDQVALLSFLLFSLSAVFLYSIWFLLLFFVYMFFLTAYLLVRVIPSYALGEAGPVFKLLFAIPVFLAMALFLFFLLPRSPYLSFGLSFAKEGVDFDEIEVGDFIRSDFSERVLLRVKPEERGEKFIYIRQKVFDIFDGKRWKKGESWFKKPRGSIIRIAYNTEHPVRYTIFPVYKFRYVPLVDYPVVLEWPKGMLGVNTRTMEVHVVGKTPPLKKYTVFSTEHPPVPLSIHLETKRFLYVPEKIVDSLRKVLSSVVFSEDTLFSLIFYLRKHHPYGAFISRTEYPILNFLKEGEKGECGEFATAFSLLARILGYKTRLVAGFLSEEFNEVGGYFIVREKHAHVWTEVFIDGKWRRFDPTPPSQKASSIIKTLLELYDVVQYIWFTRVVEFNYNDQMKLVIKSMPVFMRLKPGRQHYRKLVLFAFVLPLLVAVYFYMSYLKENNIYRRSLSAFLKYMNKKGYKKKEHETLLEFAKRSGDEKAMGFVKSYYMVKYGRADVSILKKALRELKKSS